LIGAHIFTQLLWQVFEHIKALVIGTVEVIVLNHNQILVTLARDFVALLLLISIVSILHLSFVSETARVKIVDVFHLL